MSIVTEKRLKDRSGSVCEISGSDENLVVYLVEPKTEDIPENCILITKNLKDQIENPETMNPNDWRGLSDSMWNENLPVQIVSWRMLARLKNHDLLDMMYLDEDALEWAKATGEADDDEGKIIFQAAVPISPADSPDDIAHKVHQLEHKYFPNVIESLL